jgi:hypothetical protein
LPKTCFIISPIGEDGSLTRKRSDQLFNHAIKPAVEKFEYIAVRADRIAKPGIITTQVIEQLINSELAIVDLTERNPNVYYELGIRHMVQIADPEEVIPFDIGNVRTIKVDYRFVNSMEVCRDEIINQIEEIENNKVPVESPVTFTENLASVSKNKPEKQEKINIELLSEMQYLKSELDELKGRYGSKQRQLDEYSRYQREAEYRLSETHKLKLFIDLFNQLSKGRKEEVAEKELINRLRTRGLSEVESKELIRTSMINGMIYEKRPGYYMRP